MSWWKTAAALLLALALPSAAGAGTPPRVITQPDWVAKPSGVDLETYYPTVAWTLWLEGQAMLSCEVELSGALSDCRLATESPPQLGFGPAALRMARLFKMRPRTVDGAPVSGAKINIPIAFRIPASPPPARTKPIDPEALDIARRLIAAMPADAARQAIAPPPMPPDEVTPPATREVAIQAWQTVIQADQQELLDLAAQAFARLLSREELQAWLDAVSHGQPVQPPPGETAEQVQAKLAGFDAAFQELMAPLAPRLAAETRAIFCRTQACGDAGRSPAMAAP